MRSLIMYLSGGGGGGGGSGGWYLPLASVGVVFGCLGVGRNLPEKFWSSSIKLSMGASDEEVDFFFSVGEIKKEYNFNNNEIPTL